jgi:hypothetical protein
MCALFASVHSIIITSSKRLTNDEKKRDTMSTQVEYKFGDKVKYNDDWSVGSDRCFVCNKPLGKNPLTILLGNDSELLTVAQYDALGGYAGFDAQVGSSCVNKFEKE